MQVKKELTVTLEGEDISMLRVLVARTLQVVDQDDTYFREQLEAGGYGLEDYSDVLAFGKEFMAQTE